MLLGLSVRIYEALSFRDENGEGEYGSVVRMEFLFIDGPVSAVILLAYLFHINLPLPRSLSSLRIKSPPKSNIQPK
jgi:hypothetical protein